LCRFLNSDRWRRHPCGGVCRLKHRGPDWSGLYQHEGNFLAQQRLAVVSPLSGDQPLFNEDRTVVVVVRDIRRSKLRILCRKSDFN
jgi:asparagine synthetase B (glutamine-hydrolysing)